MNGLSARQQAILAFIRDFQEERGYAPSVREIQRGCDISSTSVVDYNLRILEQRGQLRRDREVSRGIDMREERSSRPGVVDVPLMGAIAAGDPIPVPEADSWTAGSSEVLAVPESMISGRRDVYALRVKGTSMIEDLIADGDIVLIEHRTSVENGQTVVAWLKDEKETTLKRYYHEAEGRVRLQPANSDLQPRYVDPDNLLIQGRVIGVLRAGL